MRAPTVTLDARRRDDRATAPQSGATVWSNKTPIELRAGTLYRDRPHGREGQGYAQCPLGDQRGAAGRSFHPLSLLCDLTDHLRAAYVRFLKAASLATSSS